MPETLIPLATASGVRIRRERSRTVRCRCGAEATVPVGALRAPNGCPFDSAHGKFNCSLPWPDTAVKEITRLLAWLREEDAGIQVELVLVGSHRNCRSEFRDYPHSLSV